MLASESTSVQRRRRQEPQRQRQYEHELTNAHLLSTISSDDGSEEEHSAVVSCVNAGVVSITELSRRNAGIVEQMNLFGNTIASLDGLQVFTRLQELCLSNNQLQELSFHALDPLKMLRVLDLSANRLSSLRGLPLLPQLEELSVAHNKLSDLDGIVRPVKIPKVRYLDLRGNLLASPAALVPLQYLKRLAHLRLQSRDGSVANPICDQAEYPDAMLEILPSLKQLDEEEVSFLRDVSRVRMPKYESFMRRLQASQTTNRAPSSVDDASQTTPRKVSMRTTNPREMRVFVEAEQRVGYEERRSRQERGSMDAVDITEPVASSASARGTTTRRPATPTQVATTGVAVQRIVLREVSTNTEPDFGKALLECEAEALAKQTAFLARENEFLQRETDFFTREKEYLERVRRLEGQLASAVERSATIEARVDSNNREWEDKLKKMEVLLRQKADDAMAHQAELVRLRGETSNLTTQNDTLSAKWKDAQDTIAKMEQAADRYRGVEAIRSQETDARMAALATKLQEAELQLQNHQTDAKQQHTLLEARIDKLNRQLSEASSQCVALTKQNEHIGRQFEELKTSRDQFRDECLRKDDEVYQLKKALLHKTEELEEAKVHVMKMGERQDRMQQQQQQLYEKQLQASVMQIEMEFRREHQQATEKLQLLHRKYQEAVKQHLRLKGSYESSLKRESLLKDEVQRLSALLEGDKQRLVDQELTKRAEYEFRIQRLQDEKQALHEELQHAKEKRTKASALQRQVDDRQQECERLQVEIKRLEEVVCGWEVKEGDWKAALKVKDVMLDDQLRQLEELRKQKKILEEEYQQDTGEFQAQIEDLEEALDDSLQKVSTLEEKYSRAKDALATAHSDAEKANEKMNDLAQQIELKNAALELIEGEMDRMRDMLTNQDQHFQKRLEKHLEQHREELERVRSAREEMVSNIRVECDNEKAEMVQKYDVLADDLKEMAAQNTKLRVAVDHERKKNLQRDQEMRVLLAQLDQERLVKNERLNDIKRLFEQLQQESP